MDKADIYLKLFQEHRAEMRHHEQQRTTVSGFFAALTGGVLAVVGIDNTLTIADVPASLFLIVIGVFGCVFSAKQYERSRLGAERARQYQVELEAAVPGSKILSLRRIAAKNVEKRFPRLHTLRLWLFWGGLHVLIAALGLLLLVMSCTDIDSVNDAQKGAQTDCSTAVFSVLQNT